MGAPTQSPPRAVILTAHELAQRKRTLAVVLWITFGAAIVLGLNNLLIPAVPRRSCSLRRR